MDLTSNTQQRRQEEGKSPSGVMLFVLALVLLALVGQLHAEPTLRLELTAGMAQHRLAPEGSWWYDGFKNDIDLKATGFTAGLHWTPAKWGKTKLGLRAGYSDLGIVRSENTFPIFEDGSVRDARVNPHCEPSTLHGCTGKYSGSGRVKGIYFGPTAERDFGSLTLGVEGGLFYYRSSWVAINLRALDNSGNEFVPDGWADFRWDHVRAYHGTWYTGLNARWEWFYATARYYGNVRAGQSEKGKEFVGMTSGPLWSLMAGLSIPLN